MKCIIGTKEIALSEGESATEKNNNSTQAVANGEENQSGSTFPFQKNQSTTSWADVNDDENAVPTHRGRNAPSTTLNDKNNAGTSDAEKSENVTTDGTSNKKKGKRCRAAAPRQCCVSISHFFLTIIFMFM
jgi:hypothetical protein